MGKHFFLCGFIDKGFMNMRNDTTGCNGGFDECVQFFISSNGQLQMARRDTFYF